MVFAPRACHTSFPVPLVGWPPTDGFALVGLGAPFPHSFGRLAGVITVVGLSLHAFGMWDKHRVEGRDQAENPFWIVVLYWVCWLLLAGVLAMLLFWRR